MKKILIVVLMIFAVGCAKKEVIKAPEEPVKAEEAEAALTEEVVEEKILPEDEEVTDTTLPTVVEAPTFKDVLFDFNEYNIREDVRPVLESIASWLNENKDASVLIEGHCDERGTNEYNLALGEKRAKATKDYLISLGVAPNRVNTISYGEEKPLCTEQNNDCWQQNRRAHFVVAK